jgi:hypothetical protein
MELFYISRLFDILRPFGISNCHLVYLVEIWFKFSHFGLSYQETDGNLDWTYDTLSCSSSSCVN